jgi:hypothetical protein
VRFRPVARGSASRATRRSWDSSSGTAIPAERLAVENAVSDFDGSAILVTRFVEGVQLLDGAEKFATMGEPLGRLHALPYDDSVSRPGGASGEDPSREGATRQDQLAALSFLDAVDTKVAAASGRSIPPAEFLRQFRAGVHSTHQTPDELPDWLEHGARLAARERPPWEAEVPFADLAAAPFPKLVISGGHSPVFEAVCDVLARQINAQREVLAGRGHTIPTIGDAYNSLLDGFLTLVETTTRTDRHRGRHSPVGLIAT